jgi:hypothetical protein
MNHSLGTKPNSQPLIGQLIHLSPEVQYVAIDTHGQSVTICLVDNKIGGGLLQYVGAVADHTRLNVLQERIWFCREFLDFLICNSQHIDGLHCNKFGRLKWHHYWSPPPCDWPAETREFVACELDGRKFVWELGIEDSCRDGCHVVGVWRD